MALQFLHGVVIVAAVGVVVVWRAIDQRQSMTAFDLITRLSGTWAGRGRGRYPTIDAFEYSERTSFVLAAEYPMIRYEQHARLLPGDEASHWELGFWRGVTDDDVELSTAQDSGRVEVLRGTPEPLGDDGLRIHLSSVALANDARLVATERILTMQGGVLRYTKFMTTTTTPTPTRLQHLEATLERA